MRTASMAVAAAMMVAATTAFAGDIKSGVPEGGSIGTYSGTKCGGVDDGVREGASLCYTWRLGGRPVIFVFAKKPDDNLAGLVKAIDKVVEENQGARVAAVVNFTGQRTDDYVAKVKEFGEKHGLDNVALTVTTDGDRFNVSDEASVTVMSYKNKKVMSNHAVGPEGPKQEDIDAIVTGAKKIL